MNAYDRITAALAELGPVTHPRRGEARARCPAHQGRSHDSLSVAWTDGSALLHCHSGDCDAESITAALGLTLADLFDEPARGSGTNEWVNVVRRARLSSTVKLVALLVASYANSDGTNAYPGVGRLIYESDTSRATVKRALAELRKVGLLEVTKRGNRRRGQSDVYRLILAADLLDHVVVPSPDEEREAIRTLGSGLTDEPCNTFQGSSGGPSGLTGDTPPSISCHPPFERDPDSRPRAGARGTPQAKRAS